MNLRNARWVNVCLLAVLMVFASPCSALADDSNAEGLPGWPPLVVLIGTIALGVLLGRVRWREISLGSSAILLVALVAGHLGCRVPNAVGTLGLVCFVYCVGISAGPTFFRGLAQHGRSMAVLGAMLVGSGALATWMAARFLNLPADLAGGLFAGAMTSTPALGAISEATTHGGNVAVGFGVAYPFGAVAVVLFVQLMPRLASLFGTSTSDDGDSSRDNPTGIVRRLVEVLNPALIGFRPSRVEAIAESGCQLPRVLRDGRLQPMPADFSFELGQQVLVVGSERRVRIVTETLGKAIEPFDVMLDSDHQRRRVVVTSPSVVGHALKALKLLSRQGVTIVRIRRHDLEFVPTSTTVVQFGDVLTAVGLPEDLERFAKLAGHRPQTIDETDLFSLAVGILLGVLLGSIRLDVLGQNLSLGLAGGPLLAGLILGHFRRAGPIVGHFPSAARILIMEGGLALFLADAGVEAGATFVPVIRQHGLMLCAAALFVAVVPLMTGALFGRLGLQMSLMQMLGATCGGMTSTPGLAAITVQTDSSEPVICYVAAYPVALTLMTLFAPLLVKLLAS